ncbi:uncharacterized protein LOC141911226 [Tubulanus polymorphus]|uniref:uncharacterized protein LOC141911226 n=1 Tax=Tubulanus polymorphus TaxID=672921 RepID=UPI003DA5B80C
MQLPSGWIPNSWKMVPCPVRGNIQYRFTEKNKFWTQLTFHNYRNAIYEVNYRWPGEETWRTTERAKYGAFFIMKDVPADGVIEVKVKSIFNYDVIGRTTGWSECWRILQGSVRNLPPYLTQFRWKYHS